MPDLEIWLENDGVLVVALNRPEVLNAVRSSTLRELVAALTRVEVDEAVRCLVITGRGRAFCAGQDLAELASTLASTDEAVWRTELAVFQEITSKILGLTKPVVAAVNGVATGFGAELLLVCDIRIASAKARVGFVEARRALFPTNGVLWLLPRLVGHATAARMILTGELLDAAAAERAGLFSQVVGDGDALECAVALAREIARNAPLTVRRTKELLLRSWSMTLEEIMAAEVDGMVESLRSTDLVEGTQAFLEKRPPVYRGA